MTAEDMAWRPIVAAINAVERVALRHDAPVQAAARRRDGTAALGHLQAPGSRPRTSSQEAGSRLPRPLPAKSARRPPGQLVGSRPRH